MPKKQMARFFMAIAAMIVLSFLPVTTPSVMLGAALITYFLVSNDSWEIGRWITQEIHSAIRGR